MSIASRINEIETHIGDIYNTLELGGTNTSSINKNIVNIDSEIKSQYKDFLQNGTDTLYNNWEKVTGSGTSISLSNTLSAPMEIDLKGNTKQEQLSGKNLFNKYGDFNYGNSNHKTSLNSDGKIVSASNFSNSRSSGLLIENLTANTNYTLSGTLISANGTKTPVNANIQIMTTTPSVLKTIDFPVSSPKPDNFTYTFNTGTNTSLWFSFNGVNSGTTGTTETIFDNIQLEQGSTATSYEQYCGGIPSPNPDYPQDVNVVSGNNNIVVCGKNLFDKDGTDFDGHTGINYFNGKKVANNSFVGSTIYNLVSNNARCQLYFRGESGTTYYVSLDTTKYKIRANKAFGSDGIITATLLTSQQITMTTDYIGITLGKVDETDFTDAEVLELKNSIQIEKGETATTYEAYTETTYPINLPVENLFDKDNVNKINGYIDSSGKIISDASNRIIYIPCKPNTTYTISKILSQRFRVATYTTTPQVNSETSNVVANYTATHISITSRANDNYIAVWYYNSNLDTTITEQDILNSIQIEEGSKSNTYTPYGATPIELCKIGTYQDYFYKDNDKWYLHKEIGKVVLNGSEEWIASGKAIFTRITNAHCLSNTNADVGDGSIDYVICDNFAINGLGYIYTYGTTGITLFYMVNNPSEIRLAFGMGDISVNDFKTWLTTHNTIVYYEYETPTNTEITDTTLIEQLEAIASATSYEGETNINQVNNDLPFILNVSALKDID